MVVDGSHLRDAVSVDERRRDTHHPRLSWASPRPFASPDARPHESAVARRARWQRPLLRRAAAGDAMFAGVTTLVSMMSLQGLHLGTCLTAVVAGLAWVAVLGSQGAYRSWRIGSGPEEFQAILRGTLVVIVVLGLAAYSTQVLLPRRYVFVTVPLVALLSAIWRYLLRRWLHLWRRRGGAMLRTLVVGSGASTQPVVRDLARASFHGYHVVGACPPAIDLARGPADSEGRVPTLGTISDIPQVVVDHEIDVVLVTGSELAGQALRRLSWALERTGAQLVVAPGLVEVAGPHVQLRPTAGLSLVHLETPSRHLGRELGKAVLDRLMGTALLLLALPVILVCAAAVKLTSKGPAFFAQTRVGLEGKTFTMWKIRSMVVDAEDRRQELLTSSDRDGLMFKMRSDPRITPVGGFLRRFSLDEVPQLWNVVRGDMSLVGPRPPLTSEYEHYTDTVTRRLRVKPGLTGLWQVSGRADLSWEDSISLDLRYVDNWSLAMDLLILWKTLRVVLFGSGAY